MVRTFIQEVVVNCADPVRLAKFWGHLLSRPWGTVGPEWAVVGLEETHMFLAFQQVPDPKGAPMNRLHLDLQVDDLRAAVRRAVELGATVFGDVTTDADGSSFQVLRDPEENEFCFVTDPHGTWNATLHEALVTPGTR